MTNPEQPSINTPKRDLDHWLSKPGLLEHLLGGKTQADLAREAGVSQPTVNKWLKALRRNYNITPEVVLTVAARADGHSESVETYVKRVLLDEYSEPNSEKIRRNILSKSAHGPGKYSLELALTTSNRPFTALPPEAFVNTFPPISDLDRRIEGYRNLMDSMPSTTVPLLSRVPAGGLAEVVLGDVIRHVPTTSERVGKGCYALTVAGDSMTAPTSPSFPDGCTIFVRPCEEAQSGQFVVAQSDEDSSWTFKRLHIDAGKHFLIPLNERYPLMDMAQGRMRVVGVVVGGQVDLEVPF